MMYVSFSYARIITLNANVLFHVQRRDLLTLTTTRTSM